MYFTGVSQIAPMSDVNGIANTGACIFFFFFEGLYFQYFFFFEFFFFRDFIFKKILF